MNSFQLKNIDFPSMVHQICSYECNSRCINCPFTAANSDARGRHKESMFVSPEIFKKTADECGKHHSIMRVTGGGETLMCPDIVDLVKYAVDAGARVGIITNGSLLTPSKSVKFIDMGVDNIEISVDAGDQYTYSIVRAGLNWERLLFNIRCLVDYRNKAKANTKVYVSIINQKYVAPKIQEAVEFWKQRVDYAMVRKFLTFGILDENESGDRVPFQTGSSPCPWPFERITVDTNGDIILCGHEQIKRFTEWGNIKDNTLESVWNGENMSGLRKNMLENINAIPACNNCDDRRFKSWDYNYLKVLEEVEEKRK